MKKYTRAVSLGLGIVAGLVFALLSGFVVPLVALAAGPAPVNLLSAGNFTILSETGITDTGSHSSVITGNIGSSPITAAAMNDVFCSEITGTIYGVDAAYVGSGVTTCFAGDPGVPPVTPPDANKTLVDNAVGDMLTAYNDAAGRTLPTATKLGGGNIGGMTLAPGLYKWSTDVSIPTNLTLSGGPNDVWIFQVAGNLSIASGGSVPAGVKVILAGGAQASNIFWQVGGSTGATLGTYSTFNGNILSAKQVIIQTGAVLNGRALAQTQVTLDANVITVPISTVGALGEISGTKFGNSDGDGGHHRLAGVTIYLDANDNGVLDPGEPSMVTDNMGKYDFSNLPAGIYYVREVEQPGWVETYPASGSYTINLAAGEVSSKNDFADFKLGTISGTEFNDLNGNGKQDANEPGLQGWTITLTNLGGSVTETAVTDANGNYSFTGLDRGIYTISETEQSGWMPTTKKSLKVLVLSGTVSTGDNFGNDNRSCGGNTNQGNH
jgi:hypothetical protein